MRYDPDVHHRQSIRLRGYDYAREGAYFVTLCVQGRQCLFGGVAGGERALNEGGGMIEAWWRKIPEKFGDARLDEYVLMPNHFHGIIRLVGADPCVRPGFPDPCVRPGFPDPCVRPGLDPGVDKQGAHAGAGAHMGAPLQTIVQWFKTMTTNAYIRGVNRHGWPPFPGRLWQRNYFERIIRNDDELARARRYIEENPVQWRLDAENPANIP